MAQKDCKCGPPYVAGFGETTRCANCRRPFPFDAEVVDRGPAPPIVEDHDLVTPIIISDGPFHTPGFGVGPKVTTTEAVDHPAHYGGAADPYEVIKVMEAWLTPEEFRGAMKFNIHKYLARAGKKSGQGAVQDYAKAAWYAAYLDKYEKGETALSKENR